jgi:hypothetical protein
MVGGYEHGAYLGLMVGFANDGIVGFAASCE